MNDNISLQERGRNISSLIRNNALDVFQEYAALGSGGPMFLINALAFALNDEEPVLATGRVSDRGTNTVELAIFTATKVIYYKGKSAMEVPALKILPRNSLTELTVLSAPQVVPSESLTRHEDARFELKYGQVAHFTLPISQTGGEKLTEIVNGMLPALTIDLSA